MTHEPLPFIRATPTLQQREQARASELYDLGDMMLIWVNEGDIYEVNFADRLKQKMPHELTKWGHVIAFILGTFGALLSQAGLGLIITNPLMFGWGLAMTVDGILLALICWSAAHTKEKT